MKDWERKLDDFLEFNERRVLPHAGKVGKQEAEHHAKLEYDQFADRRREYKETIGAVETIKQVEDAAKMIPRDKKEIEKD